MSNLNNWIILFQLPFVSWPQNVTFTAPKASIDLICEASVRADLAVDRVCMFIAEAFFRRVSPCKALYGSRGTPHELVQSRYLRSERFFFHQRHT
jgi:hypothetical protein